jgi:hypothetical protein
MLRLSTLLIVLCVLSSCQKDVEYNDGDYQAKLVLNAVFSPDELWNIHLCKTNSIFEENNPDDKFINATIRIEDLTDNSEIQFEQLEDGSYQSIGFTPKQGHSYEIFVDSEEYGQVYSSTYVPTVGALGEYQVETVNFKGQDVYKIDLEITDLPYQENYYVWEVVEDSENDQSIKIFSGDDISSIEDAIDQNAPATFNPKIKGDFVFVQGTVTEDNANDFFNTSLIAIASNGLDSNGNLNPGSISDHQIKLKVRALSKDLFMHLKSLDELSAINSSNNEPGAIYSNIQNGYGIFGAFNEKTITIQ